MKMIVGLGNPGKEYEKTRHNVGRLLLEYIAEKESLSFSQKRVFKASLTRVLWKGKTILLAYPEVYVNLSGEAVLALSEYHGIDVAHDLLIVVDDLSLPFGQWRLRAKGSSGGHNGLKSVEAALKTKEYNRLRFGIDRPSIKTEQCSENEQAVKDYVLARFDRDELKKLPAELEEGRLALKLWAENSIEKAMSVLNSCK